MTFQLYHWVLQSKTQSNFSFLRTKIYFPCSQAEIHTKMKEMPRIVNKQICGINYKQKNENIPSGNRNACLKMPPNTN